MSKTVTTRGPAGPARSRHRATAGLAVTALLLTWFLVSVFVHPLPHQASDRAGAPLLPGAEVAPSVVGIFSHACINCHSEKTLWPWYSYLAPFSWLVENDVKRARRLLNLSRWDTLDPAEQRLLLTAIATVIENREMPPHKYVVFHPEVKLSTDDSVQVIEWTRAERRRLRASVTSLTAK